MIESARITYLEQLGIDSFVPRVILPYAPQPSRCVDCELSETPVVLEASQEALGKDQSVASAESDGNPDLRNTGGNEPIPAQAAELVLGELVTRLSSKSTTRPATLPPDAAQNLQEKLEPVERPTFSLSIWRSSAPLLVIDSHRQGAALPTERLLHNTLRHSGWKSPQLQPCQYQHWPMAGASEEYSGWQYAKEMFDSFFDGIFATQRVDCLWLMGENAYRAANGENVAGERPFLDLCFTEIKLRENSLRALVLPSLAEILEQPLVKQKIWQLI